jgi:hypothetical protein
LISWSVRDTILRAHLFMNIAFSFQCVAISSALRVSAYDPESESPQCNTQSSSECPGADFSASVKEVRVNTRVLRSGEVLVT